MLMSTKNERKEESKFEKKRVENYSPDQTPSIWYS